MARTLRIALVVTLLGILGGIHATTTHSPALACTSSPKCAGGPPPGATTDDRSRRVLTDPGGSQPPRPKRWLRPETGKP